MKIIILTVTVILLIVVILKCMYMWMSYHRSVVKEHIGVHYNHYEPSGYGKQKKVKHEGYFKPTQIKPPEVYTTPKVYIPPKKEPIEFEQSEPEEAEEPEEVDYSYAKNILRDILKTFKLCDEVDYEGKNE